MEDKNKQCHPGEPPPATPDYLPGITIGKWEFWIGISVICSLIAGVITALILKILGVV